MPCTPGDPHARFGTGGRSGLSIVDDQGMMLALQQLAVSLAMQQQQRPDRSSPHHATMQARNHDVLMLWSTEQVCVSKGGG